MLRHHDEFGEKVGKNQIAFLSSSWKCKDFFLGDNWNFREMTFRRSREWDKTMPETSRYWRPISESNCGKANKETRF